MTSSDAVHVQPLKLLFDDCERQYSIEFCKTCIHDWFSKNPDQFPSS